MNPSSMLGLVVAGILAAPVSQALTLGSATLITARDCTGLPDNWDCPAERNPYLREYFGGVNTTIDLDRQDPLEGRFVVRTSFDADGLPVLKGGTWSSATTRINTNTTVYQSFRYTGPDGVPFSLVGDLTFDTSGYYGDDGSFAEEAGEGTVYVIMNLLDTSVVEGLVTAEDIFSNVFLLPCGQPGVYGWDGFSHPSGEAGPQSHTLRLDRLCDGSPILLSSGAEFVLAISLQTPSNRLGYSDVTNTLRVQFDPELPAEVVEILRANLETAVPNRVPEPASLALLGLGLAGLGLSRRRKA